MVIKLLKGKGRAFCAGGDIVSLYKLINEGTNRIFEIMLCSLIIYLVKYTADLFSLSRFHKGLYSLVASS